LYGEHVEKWKNASSIFETKRVPLVYLLLESQTMFLLAKLEPQAAPSTMVF